MVDEEETIVLFLPIMVKYVLMSQPLLSKQPMGRRLFEAQGGSPSAEGDLRNFLKKVS